jgi:hypothetical protein
MFTISHELIKFQQQSIVLAGLLRMESRQFAGAETELSALTEFCK